MIEGEARRDQRRIWTSAVACGLAAGLVAWLEGEMAVHAFKPQTFAVRIILSTFIQSTTASENAASTKNAVLAFVLLGATTGLAMGLAGCIAGQFQRRGAIITLLGGVAGAALAGLVSWKVVPGFFQGMVPDPNDIITPILVHGAVFVSIGAVGAVVFVLALGRAQAVPQAVAGACLGACLATVLSHIIGAGLFPDSQSTTLPVPESSLLRLISRLLVTFLVAVGAAWGASPSGLRTDAAKPLPPLDV
jgi:hypothetical protein